MFLRTLSIALTVIAFNFSILPVDTRADEKTTEAFTTRHAARLIAERVKVQLGANAPQAILLRPFSAPKGAYDVGFPTMVGEELQRLGFQIRDDAACELEGRIARTPTDPDLPPTGIVFFGGLFLNESPLANSRFEILINNVDEAAERVEPSGELALPPDLPTNSDRTPDHHPTVVKSFQMAPHPESPYSVSIERLDGDQWTPVTPIVDRGDFRIELPLDCRFRIAYHNDSGFEAWARTTLDGMGRFAFAKERRFRNAADIVPVKQTATRSCFYRDQEGGDGFKIGESFAAAKMKSPIENVGYLVVTFGAAWKVGEAKPPFEPTRDGLRGRSPLGVDLGPPVVEVVQEVKRELGDTRATVRIRYDVK